MDKSNQMSNKNCKTYLSMAYLLLSWFIVAFGQPAWMPWLGLAAAACGYALFWKGLIIFPSWKQRFLAATLWFAFVQSIQLSWMTSVKYVGSLVLIVYGLLTIAWGVQFALISLWVPRSGTVSILRMLFIAAFWTILEWSRLHILSGFSWNPAGLALSGNVYPLQMAAVGGIYGMTFWVMLVNLLAFNIFKIFEQRNSFAYAKPFIIAWIVLGVFPYAFGWLHVAFHESRMASSSPLTVLAIQTFLKPDQKVPYKEFEGVALSPLDQWKRILNELKDYRGKQIDLILLPEGTVPYGTDYPIYPLASVQETLIQIFNLGDAHDLPAPYTTSASTFFDENHRAFWAAGNGYWAQAIADLFHANVIIGLEDFVKASGKKSKSYQAAFHYRPFEKTAARYEKRILVPMGEYIPFNWCKGLAARYGVYDSFSPGTEAKIFQCKIPMGISICYEETYGNLMRENRLMGAAVLINLTNDGWYPDSKLPRQHLDHSRPRTVENGFALLRACNTGVSAIVDSLGRTVAELGSDQESPSNTPQVLSATVSSYNYQTLYTFWGDKFIIGLCILMVSVYFFAFLRNNH
jgi:apolipoprotein N-acyltransferase